MRKVVAVVGAVVLAGLIVLALLRTPIEVSSSARPDVAVLCDAPIPEEACRSWGDAILADGAPSFTFEMDDLARLELTRTMFGFGSTCEATYFIARELNEAVWKDDVSCRGNP